MSAPLFLAIDVGTHAVKIALYDAVGALVDLKESSITLHQLDDPVESRVNGLRVEQSPVEILTALKQCFALIPGELLTRVQSIGLAVQRSSVLAWNKQSGEPLSQVLSWQDTRCQSVVVGLSQYSELIREKTGLKLSAHYGASKLQYLSERFSGFDVCLSPLSAFLCYHLSADRPVVCDQSNAQRTMLWNINDQCWDELLIDLFKVDCSKLPGVVPVQHNFGRLSPEFSSSCSGNITAVIGDQNAIASYLLADSSKVVVNMGTGAFVLSGTGNSKDDAGLQLKTLVSSSDQTCTFATEGTVNGAGSALTWLLNRTQYPDFSTEEKLITALGAWLQSDEPIVTVFLNSVGGLGSPYWKPGFVPSFQPEYATAREKAIAVIESIVFLIVVNIQLMRSDENTDYSICVSGGLSRFDGICQRLADLCQVNVLQMLDHECTLIGAARLASNGVIPRSEHCAEYTARINIPLKKRFGRFTRLIDSKHQVVAHRGYASSYPENSLRAFEACIENGVSACECDIQLTRDGVPVVFHDADLLRLAGEPVKVSELCYQQLLTYSVHEENRFGETYNPTRMPRLFDFISLLNKSPNITAFIEVKKDIFDHCSREVFYDSISEQLESIEFNAYIISYDLEFLRVVQAKGTLAVGWVLSQYDEPSFSIVETNPVDVLISNIERLPNERGNLWQGPWEWFAYEIADKRDIQKCQALGIYWLESRNPLLIQRLLVDG